MTICKLLPLQRPLHRLHPKGRWFTRTYNRTTFNSLIHLSSCQVRVNEIPACVECYSIQTVLNNSHVTRDDPHLHWKKETWGESTERDPLSSSEGKEQTPLNTSYRGHRWYLSCYYKIHCEKIYIYICFFKIVK